MTMTNLTLCWHDPKLLDPLLSHPQSAQAAERGQNKMSLEDSRNDTVSCDRATKVREHYLWTAAQHQTVINSVNDSEITTLRRCWISKYTVNHIIPVFFIIHWMDKVINYTVIYYFCQLTTQKHNANNREHNRTYLPVWPFHPSM